MKTTIEISDPLLKKARVAASREGITLRALVGGDGLAPEFRDASWIRIRDAIYEDRGA